MSENRLVYRKIPHKSIDIWYTILNKKTLGFILQLCILYDIIYAAVYIMEMFG